MYLSFMPEVMEGRENFVTIDLSFVCAHSKMLSVIMEDGKKEVARKLLNEVQRVLIHGLSCTDLHVNLPAPLLLC